MQMKNIINKGGCENQSRRNVQRCSGVAYRWEPAGGRPEESWREAPARRTPPSLQSSAAACAPPEGKALSWAEAWVCQHPLPKVLASGYLSLLFSETLLVNLLRIHSSFLVHLPL